MMKVHNVKAIQRGTGELVEVAVRAMPKMDELASEERVKAIKDFLAPNIEQGKSLTVTNEDSKQVAYQFGCVLKPFGTSLDKARKQINAKCKEVVDGRLMPLITDINETMDHIEGSIDGYDEQERREAAERQRKLDEKRRKEEAELARRQKIQDAHVEKGHEARTEIPHEVERTEITVPTAEDKRVHYRIRYRVLNVADLPDEFIVKTENKAKLNQAALTLEDKFEKTRKGIDEIPQTVSGVEFYWDSVRRFG
jgi:hypothetical protein